MVAWRSIQDIGCDTFADTNFEDPIRNTESCSNLVVQVTEARGRKFKKKSIFLIERSYNYKLIGTFKGNKGIVKT